MPIDADVLVVWSVSVAVLVSVAWLALHGWRQGRRLRRWAAGRNLPCRRRGGDSRVRLGPFRRDDEHLVRELGRVREVVELEQGGRIFRCEEKLDFTPWSSGTGPPRTRIVAAFPVSDVGDTYSVFDERGRPSSDRAPGLRFSSRPASRKLERRLPAPPHPVSVTLSEGRGLAYLLTPSGDVSEDDLDYLARLVERLARRKAGGEERAPGPPELEPSRGAPVDRRRIAPGAGGRGRPDARAADPGA